MPVFKDRVEKIRCKMEHRGISAFLISHPPNILYGSGFTGSSAWLLLTMNRVILYTDFRYIQQATEEAPFCEITKLDSSVTPSLFLKIWEVLMEETVSAIGVEEARLTLKEYNQLKDVANGLEIIPCSGLLEGIRSVKEEMEIDNITKAARIADSVLKDTLPLLKPGMSEREFAGELEYRIRLAGAEGMAFPTIVASGPRSALPHGIATNRNLVEGELIVLDFGVVWQGYCSDMTRTYILGEPTAQQERIHKIVCNARSIALQTIKVGDRTAAIDAVVRQYLQDEGYGDAYGHGLGHGVGLEVHERPTLSPRGEDVLQENMVFSVEPGIYLEGQEGVRVEDLVVLRSDGPQVITGSRRELNMI